MVEKPRAANALSQKRLRQRDTAADLARATSTDADLARAASATISAADLARAASATISAADLARAASATISAADLARATSATISAADLARAASATISAADLARAASATISAADLARATSATISAADLARAASATISAADLARAASATISAADLARAASATISAADLARAASAGVTADYIARAAASGADYEKKYLSRSSLRALTDAAVSAQTLFSDPKKTGEDNISRAASLARQALKNIPSHTSTSKRARLRSPDNEAQPKGAKKATSAHDLPAESEIRSALDLGLLVKSARRARSMSQQQFSDLAGVGRRFLSELESGKSTLELGKVLQVLAAAGFDISISKR